MRLSALIIAMALTASSASAAEVATLEYQYYNTESEYVLFKLFDDASDIVECKGKMKASATFHTSYSDGKVDVGCWSLNEDGETVLLKFPEMKSPFVIHKTRFNSRYTSQELSQQKPLAGICPTTPQQ